MSENQCLVDKISFPTCIESYENLHTAVMNLNAGNPFANFNLDLSIRDTEVLNALRIERYNEYLNFGQLETLYGGIKYFIESISVENKEISHYVTNLIINLVNNTIQSSNQGQSAWVILRAYTPNNDFDLPRLHTDPCLAQEVYESKGACMSQEHNVVITLKGSHTLFYDVSPKLRARFVVEADMEKYPDNQDSELLQRQALANMLSSVETFSSNFGQGSVFLVGAEEELHSAIHTAPPIHDERIFLVVFPGKVDVINMLGEIIARANAEAE